MDEKRLFNDKISRYFYRLHCEFGSLRNKKYLRISERVKSCLNMWVWDAYYQNLVLDLKKVNRCKCKFCSNCRRLDLSRAFNNLIVPFSEYIKVGYMPIFVTLTVPNCKGEDLSFVLDKMNLSFKKFWNWFHLDGKNGFSKRFLKFFGAVRCIEVTYNSHRSDYHPHYHLLILIRFCDYDEILFYKYIDGEWSDKRQQMNYLSDIDVQVRKLWTLAYTNSSLSNYSSLVDLYKCDVQEMYDDGISEVLKYSFKDTDLLNYFIFKDLYFSLYNRRLRQGYGNLYNVKLENDSDGVKQDLYSYLLFNKEELPVELVTRDMETLYNGSHKDYTKISRFNKDSFINDL